MRRPLSASGRRLAVLLLSGGLDSTTVAAAAKRDGYEVSAITVHYGQSHAREIEAARAVAGALEIEHRVVDVSFFKDLAWYSALTHPEQFALAHGRSPEEMTQDIPLTYVPLRNTMFLSLGAAFLESMALDAIEVRAVPAADMEASLFIAANAIDYSGYPDCRPEYFRSVTETLRLGSKLGAQYGVSMAIRTPLLDKTKGDIVRLGVEVRAPLELTWSCYGSGPGPCGQCDSCMLRAKGFEEAGVADPVLQHA